MLRRNLLQEASAMHDASAAAADVNPASKKRARPPVEPPMPRHYDEREQNALSKADVMQMVHESVHGEHDRVIVIEVSDKFCDTVLGDGDANMIGMLQLVSGAYFDTNIKYGGRTIWKSVQLPEGHHNHMIWFVYNNSWYCADDLFQDDKDRDLTKISMWAKLHDNDDVPRQAHFPYWSKKACHAIKIRALWNYMMAHVGGLMGGKPIVTEGEVDNLLARIFELEGLLEDEGKSHPDHESGSHKGHHDHGGNASSSSSSGGGGKGGGEEKSRGGWMPKVATIITAVYERKWDYVKKLADRMYDDSPMLRKLVDQKLTWT